MKALLDEALPRKLVFELRALDCQIDPFPNGWKGIKNGQLLDRMQMAGFHCLVTCDKNMQWQQSLHDQPLAILVLPTQNLETLRSIAIDIAEALKQIQIGQIDNLITDLTRPRTE